MTEDMFEQLYIIADQLRSTANYGLMHQKNPYDRERLQEVLSASARMVSLLDNRSPDSVMSIYKDDMDHISPMVGSEAAVFRDNKLLLIKRDDDKLWAIPGGLTGIGETLQQSALRELKEETGLEGKVTRLLGIFDSRFWKTRSKNHLYHVIFEVSAGNASPQITNEALECRFFGADEIPELSPGHDARVPFVFKLYRGEIEPPYFD